MRSQHAPGLYIIETLLFILVVIIDMQGSLNMKWHVERRLLYKHFVSESKSLVTKVSTTERQ